LGPHASQPSALCQAASQRPRHPAHPASDPKVSEWFA
jgi:hypothetical protein